MLIREGSFEPLTNSRRSFIIAVSQVGVKDVRSKGGDCPAETTNSRKCHRLALDSYELRGRAANNRALGRKENRLSHA
jgi:hypothetical protein